MNAGGVSQGQKNFPFSNIQQYEFFDDFENITNWTLVNNAGAGLVSTYDNDTVINLRSIENTTCGIQRYFNNVNTGNTPISNPLYFKSRIKVNSLTGCNISVGFGNRNVGTGAIFTSGFYFNFRTSINPNFRIISSNNSISTIITTNVELIANTFYVLECFYNVSNINFFINGVFVGTISTNIPNVSLTPSIYGVNNTLGTTFIISPDYWYHRQTFSTNRG